MHNCFLIYIIVSSCRQNRLPLTRNNSMTLNVTFNVKKAKQLHWQMKTVHIQYNESCLNEEPIPY